MASQNLPGLAVLSAYDYRPAPGPLIATTGAFTLLAAPFGGHAVNLGAITAALCAAARRPSRPGEALDRRRFGGLWLYRAGPTGGRNDKLRRRIAYPHRGGRRPRAARRVRSALNNALANIGEREAALVTFLTAASGLSFFGIGGAFWGLIAGGAILGLTRAGAPKPEPEPSA